MMRARDMYELECDSEESPAKKQRLSSPTYDEQFELSQDQIQAFDLFDRQFSQRPSTSTRSPPKPSQAISAEARRRRSLVIETALKEDASKDLRNELVAARARSTSIGPEIAVSHNALQSLNSSEPVSKLPQHKYTGFGSALNVAADHSHSDDRLPSSSPEAPPEPDLAAWFRSDNMGDTAFGFTSAKALAEPADDWFTAPTPAGAMGFRSAKAISTASEATPFDGSAYEELPEAEEVPIIVGFRTGSSLMAAGAGKKSLLPSAESLAKAAERMKQWEKEMQDDFPEDDEDDDVLLKDAPTFQPMFRPVLEAVENSFAERQPPSTPSPAGGKFTSLTPLVSRATSEKKVFKSPLITTAATKEKASTSYIASPLNPTRFTDPKPPVTPARAGPLFAPAKLPTMSPPKKSLGVTPRRAVGGPSGIKTTFSTPFKSGMKPGEPGRLRLDVAGTARKAEGAAPSVVKMGVPRPTPLSKAKGKERAVCFDLAKPVKRQSLAACGMRPQSRTDEELEGLGINVHELNQMHPDMARYYSFNSPTSIPREDGSAPPPTAATLGVSAALDHLHSLGCSLATKPWIENHWGMILWKLAGMVCLDPESETDPNRKRWCWPEVIRQLRYRYERELNGGSRPPLRLIAAQDSPATLPMVLCVSNITWTPGGIDEHDIPRPAVPELEVTDGWYRVHAEIDGPIIRAVRDGKITVGRKIGVSGARLSGSRKEAVEILEGADSIGLKICGNSSHLVPWHAKLGFQRDPFISTLGSLTSDGGLVSVSDLVITKVYPIAYFEFVEEESGEKRREGPRNEREEAAAQDKWMARRDAMAGKLRGDIEAKLHTLEGYADRLERKAGSSFRPSIDDSAPDKIDDLLCDLEDNPDANSIIKHTTSTEAGWLTRAIKEKCQRDREALQEDIARELDSSCPPREVRSFRVVVVKDAQTYKRPAQRSAQITVWDVFSAYVSEDGGAGTFKEGQRFMVTNLVPTQASAWMPRGDDSVIYLATRKDSLWKRHKL